MRRLLPLVVVLILSPRGLGESPSGVAVTILEGVADKRAWELDKAKATEQYARTGVRLRGGAPKVQRQGRRPRSLQPVRLAGRADHRPLRAGEYRILLRSLNAARLFLDDKPIAQTDFLKVGGSHEEVPDLPTAKEKGLRPLPLGHQEQIVKVNLTDRPHTIRLEALVGGQKLRPEIGELCVGIARAGEPFRLLSADRHVPLSDDGWQAYATERRTVASGPRRRRSRQGPGR